MKKYFFGLLLLIWGCDNSSNVSAPDKNYFLKYYGQDGNQTAVDLIVNSDGTFFILGNSTRLSSDTLTIYLAKANALGEMVWQKTYTYNHSLQTQARDFELTADGRLAVVANVTSNGNTDILLARFALDGTLVDNKILTIGSQTPSANEYASSITALSNGGFVVIGYTDFVTIPGNQYSALHLRTDNTLTQLQENTDHWHETTEQGTINYGVKAFQTPSDTSYIFGYSNAFNPNLSFWTFGLTLNGYLPASDDPTEFINTTANDYLTDVVKAEQGYLMAGISIGTSGTMSLKLIKLQYDNLTFYGSSNPQKNEMQYAYSTASGSLGKGNVQYATVCNSSSAIGYFALTNIYTSSGTSDMWLMKFTNELQPAWTNPVQLGGNGNDTSAAVAELPDGHIVVLGTINVGTGTTTKIALLKLNANGQLTD